MKKGIAVLFTNDGMSSAEPELRHKLAENYLGLLDKENYLPAFICFYGQGAKLVATGSPVIEQLKKLEARGVTIVVCKTCLTYYNLLDSVQVGNVGTMHDIVDIQWNADKVITV